MHNKMLSEGPNIFHTLSRKVQFYLEKKSALIVIAPQCKKIWQNKLWEFLQKMPVLKK
tara:strand:+ start:153 stop:326 length:174 start_codon:yes stop_codon:yes gene_type:complete